MVQLETKHFPLVLLDLGGSDRTPEEVRSVFGGFHLVHGRARADGKRWVLVAVTEFPPNAVERKILAEEANKFSAQDTKLCAANVLVIPNGIIRAVVTALSWLIPNMPPLAAAPTSSAAVDQAIERLRAIGIDVPQPAVVQAKRWFLRNESTPKARAASGERGPR